MEGEHHREHEPIEKSRSDSWEGKDGLDHLLHSVSLQSQPVQHVTHHASHTDTVFRAPAEVKPPTPTAAVAATAPAPTSPSPPTVIPASALQPTETPIVKTGTLSVSVTPSAASSAPAPVMLKSSSKKPPQKKGLGAKKLVSTPQDIHIESFNSVEKRAAAAKQVEEDHKVAVALQQQESQQAGVSRISSLLQEESKSIYRSTPKVEAPTPAPSRYTSRAPVASTSNGTESTLARDKYSTAKSISSEQFYGNEEDLSALKGKLGQYSSAKAISSDLLYHDRQPSLQTEDDGLTQLKESVKDFFQDINRRMH